MKHSILSIISILLCITSCTSDLSEEAINTGGMHTYRMHLEGGFGSYSDEPSSRAAMTIADGTELYLILDGMMGTAKYHSSQGEWSLTYTGSLSGSGKCAAYYIPDGTDDYLSNSVIMLTSSCAVYGTDTGTYSIDSDGSITVKATLSPIFSRFRLKGASGTRVQVKGVNVASAFSYGNNFFYSYTPKAITATVGSDGYSDYIYYYGAQPETLSVINGSKIFSTKSPLKNDGKSMFFDIPTEANYSGWTIKDRPAEPTKYVAVDLGLSVKWATFNVGANAPEEYGDYFAWGETEAKSVYLLSTYKWCSGTYTTISKYCVESEYGTVDNKTVLDPEDDVAHVKWGGSWRMPTLAEQDELRSKCTWTWTTQNGVAGCMVKSKINGNSIFLPAAGERIESSVSYPSEGFYLSSSLGVSFMEIAYSMVFGSDLIGIGLDDRYCGRSVRPVCP